MVHCWAANSHHQQYDQYPNNVGYAETRVLMKLRGVLVALMMALLFLAAPEIVIDAAWAWEAKTKMTMTYKPAHPRRQLVVETGAVIDII